MVCTLLAGVNVVAFAADDDELTDSVSVLRAYNPNNSEHLYTIDETEYNANVSRGYQGEGEAWKAPIYSETEVWRAYNPNSGEHMLASEAEVYALEAAGWQNEGFKMYSDDAMGTPIYRVFNPNSNDAGSHHYCGYEEAAGLVGLGWEWDNDGEPVIYGVKGEEPVVVVNLTDAKQLSANTIEVKFDQAATGLVAKEDIDVSKADGTLTIPVNNMTLSDDGMSAVLELAVALQDKAEYAVSLNDSMSTFTASVGEVATVAILTSSAQQNVATPIEFKLFDETGVDVTSTVNVDATCSVSVDGNVTSDTSKASKSTITMDTVGDTATVTVTYNAGELDSEDVVATGIITCIEPEAEVGMPIYADVDPDDETLINAESNCAKFYWGDAVIMDSAVKVEVNESNDGIYFCAATAIDPDGVIAYDSYTVESSNEDIMSVTADVDSGKFAQMTVSGNMVGSANIVVIATKNGKDTPYTIPVTVTKTGVLSSVNYTVSRNKLSNAIDEDYYGTATAYGVDSNGNVVTDADVTFSVVDFDKKGGNNKDIDENVTDGLIEKTLSGFLVDGGETADGPIATFSAWNAEGGSRTLKATVSDGDIVKEKSTTINVEALPSGIWNSSLYTTDAKLTYSVELGASTLIQGGTGSNDTPTTTARLAATYGGKFVGYVRQLDDGTVVVGTPASTPIMKATALVPNMGADGKTLVANSGIKFTAKAAGSSANGVGIAFVPNTKATTATGQSITVEDLAGHPVITFTYGLGTVGAASYIADYNALVAAYAASGDEDLEEIAAVTGMFNLTKEGTVNANDIVAGMVLTDGGYDFNTSTVAIDATTELSDIYVGVKYGNKYSTPYLMSGSGIFNLTDSAENMIESEPVEYLNEEGAVLILSLLPDGDEMMLVSGDTKQDANFARPGSYTVEFAYTIGDGTTSEKETKSTTNMTVKNNMTQMAPTVTVKDRNVDDLSEATIIENMATMVDLNNNTSSHASIKSLWTVKDGELAPIEPGETSVNVKYAMVDDNIGGYTVHFYVPINKTFYLK